jgi:hypothetical protein
MTNFIYVQDNEIVWENDDILFEQNIIDFDYRPFKHTIDYDWGDDDECQNIWSIHYRDDFKYIDRSFYEKLIELLLSLGYEYEPSLDWEEDEERLCSSFVKYTVDNYQPRNVLK